MPQPTTPQAAPALPMSVNNSSGLWVIFRSPHWLHLNVSRTGFGVVVARFGFCWVVPSLSIALTPKEARNG